MNVDAVWVFDYRLPVFPELSGCDAVDIQYCNYLICDPVFAQRNIGMGVECCHYAVTQTGSVECLQMHVDGDFVYTGSLQLTGKCVSRGAQHIVVLYCQLTSGVLCSVSLQDYKRVLPVHKTVYQRVREYCMQQLTRCIRHKILAR